MLYKHHQLGRYDGSTREKLYTKKNPNIKDKNKISFNSHQEIREESKCFGFK